MLRELGMTSLDDLYSHIPQAIRSGPCDSMFPGLSEYQVKQVVRAYAARNKTVEQCNSFLGAGIYDHYVPAAVRELLSRAEFYTSYTPYQAECSQGVLQAIYEYQTFICLLTDMDVTNASLYDGPTALAEAVLMSLRITKKDKVIVARSLHPDYRAVLQAYLAGNETCISDFPWGKKGVIECQALSASIDEQTACVVVQSPGFLGSIEDICALSACVHAKGALLVLVVNPMSLALLKSPGALGVDIVCGDGQVLGGNPNCGGPTFGFLAARGVYMRQFPGRIVGKTVDCRGGAAYCLTLQTREQHIRREKATSNICSNESLNAIGAAIYLSLLGADGLRSAAARSCAMAHYLYQRLREIPQVTFPFEQCFFNEFVWCIENAGLVRQKLAEQDIYIGVSLENIFPELSSGFISACTEKKSEEDIDRAVDALREVIGG